MYNMSMKDFISLLTVLSTLAVAASAPPLRQPPSCQSLTACVSCLDGPLCAWCPSSSPHQFSSCVAIADALLTGVAQAGSSCRSLLLPGLAEPSGTTCTNSRVSVQRRWSLSGDASAVADVHDRLALVVPQHATHPQASAALRDAADRCSNEAARLLSEATAPSGGDVMSPQGTPLNGVALALGLWSCALHLHKGHGTTLNNLGILARHAFDEVLADGRERWWSPTARLLSQCGVPLSEHIAVSSHEFASGAQLFTSPKLTAAGGTHPALFQQDSCFGVQPPQPMTSSSALPGLSPPRSGEGQYRTQQHAHRKHQHQS